MTSLRSAPPRPAARARVRVGRLWVDAVSLEEAVNEVEGLVKGGRGAAVFTPNVDHVVLADAHVGFRRAYQRADLVLADGAPVVWASRLLGLRVPEKVSGSDFVVPVARRGAERGWRVYLLGATPDVAAEAARCLQTLTGVDIVGVDSPIVSLDADPAVDDAIVERVRRARPHVVFVALGAPKQEVWTDRVRSAVGPAVMIGVGASLDFIAGRKRRAPRLISTLGLEWLFRLAQEPRRLWRRYLLRDPGFLWIVLRTLLAPRHTRVYEPAAVDTSHALARPLYHPQQS